MESVAESLLAKEKEWAEDFDKLQKYIDTK